MSFFENTRKPVGLDGKLMVAMMNLGHSPVGGGDFDFYDLRQMPRCWIAAVAAGRT